MSEITLSPLLGNTSLRAGFRVVLTKTGPELDGDDVWAKMWGGTWIDLGELMPPGDKEAIPQSLGAFAGRVAKRIPDQGAIGTVDAILDATLELGDAVTASCDPTDDFPEWTSRNLRRRLERPTPGEQKRPFGRSQRQDTRLRPKLTRAAAVGMVAAAKNETAAIRGAAWGFLVLHYLTTERGWCMFYFDPRDVARAVAELLAARIVHAAFINPKVKIPPRRQAHIMECGLVRDGIFPSGFSLDAAGGNFL